MLIISAHRYTGDLNIQLQNLIKSQIVGSRQQRARKLNFILEIAVYRAGHNVGQNRAERKEWKSDTKVLKKQVQYAREKHVDGFAFFDYQDLKSKTSAKAVNQLKTVLK